METGTLKKLNVKPGDVVECVEASIHTTLGEMYTVNENCDILNYRYGRTNDSKFRVVSRASDAPKKWDDMTDAEKGSLLLAEYEGKVIEAINPDNPEDDWDVDCGFIDGLAYRIRPETERETVNIYGGVRGTWAFDYCSASATHQITFETVDGEPDCSTIKMEPVE